MTQNEANGLAFQAFQDYIQVDGLDRYQQLLRQFYMTDQESDMVKKVRKAIAYALWKARQEGLQKIKIPNNQRHAEQALRTTVYSKKSGVLGGNMTILRSHRNGNAGTRPVPPGKDETWSDRTKQVWGYQGADAQFILYWLTEGTKDRKAGLGRARYRNGNAEYGTTAKGNARQRYFNGSHNVGKISADTINPNLVAILQKVVDGQFVQDIERIYQETANQTK